ncbi:hypothetical protein R1Y80_04720 [Streptomyces sp. JL1001]|uniref:PE domain-containing protein n=1 Tax=Streptomyces sp. JL1001 TaxID=3078227 RepID=A0AAU8KDI1_9ACTN|nr:hypothetical protein [Streptomyces sp. Ncost-T6T-1]MYV64178.1 hypothetical protein [Streptomyces sp. SID4931]SBU94372.1 hypothetical protein YW5DRAFT_04729 [Streptomyces sp. Ncost-T6T-1]SCG10031.1 hypothetical protein GA0115255_126623 [Streptomyces sp. Ncost-T6T-2b]
MGHYRFQDLGMADVQRVGALQVEECNEIWSDVMTQIGALFPDGDIDAGLAGVLSERNEKYQRDVQQYAEDLGLQNTAVGRTREIAADGGEAMRRAASL